MIVGDGGSHKGNVELDVRESNVSESESQEICLSIFGYTHNWA